MPSNMKRIAPDGQSQQEVIAAKITRDKQQEHIEHCQHLLSVLEHRPPLWTKPEFKQVRESIQRRRRQLGGSLAAAEAEARRQRR